MRKRNNRGFTMAELLIVVAIIGVLSGVSFIAVQNHQRSLTQLERNTVAKEIYFAAQNHLTMAESQGLLNEEVDSTFYGTEETSDDRTAAGIAESGDDIYYVVANGGTRPPILDLMLPFGSIDETVRAGGFYIIRYQANPAIVLDVFYCSRSGKPEKYNYTDTDFSGEDYNTFLGYRGKDKQPKNGYVVGWYGGAAPGETGTYLKTPSLTVSNAEKLTVTVTDPNKNNGYASLQLIVTGVSSGAQAVFDLTLTNTKNDRVILTKNEADVVEHTITLDDISKDNDSSIGWHFADLNNSTLRGYHVQIADDKPFTPGEDIVVVAVAFSNRELTNIAYSNEVTTNSLYADVIVKEATEEQNPETLDTITVPGSTTAIISCIRHLENLDQSLSGWAVGLTDARQVADLDWGTFTGVERTVSVCKAGDIENGTKPGCYLPVNPGAALTYDGNNHAISNIVVDTTGDANPLEIDAGGVFGELINGSCVKNLEIRDIKVTLASGNAGALVGTLTQSTALEAGQFNVSNVVAYNTDETKYATAFISTGTGTGTGNAGGLIGATKGADGALPTPGVCRIEKSAAAVGVSSAGGEAGGLIGKMDGGQVVGCYSGGHTINDTRTGSDAVIYDPAKPNVKASGTGNVAGGLIGDAGTAAISNSYSTCSAKGATAGGLVGSSEGEISNSYATGLVDGTTYAGAFAGTYSGTATDCRYFEIINEQWSDTAGYTYLGAVRSGPYSGITPLDETAAFDAFLPTEWQVAAPYNATLGTYYGGKYPLKTVEQLSEAGAITVTDFVATHYGDWPAPEIFVINK